MNKLLDKCMLCPKNCMVNRNKLELGFCKTGNKIRIGKAYLHKWEEPCISGKYGSGTIFFSGCNLRCIFCQNYYISELNNGVEIDSLRFSEICLDLQDRGATNINLVTPTHYVPLIIEGLKVAKSKGLKIPIVYNSSGYEKVDTIRLLEGIVDVYLPDFKYYSDSYAVRYSRCKDYFKYASLAIEEMVRQRPECIFDKDGNMISGVMVRHLLLPKMDGDSKKILSYLYNQYGNRIYYSIMNQYTPVRECKYTELNDRVDSSVYDDLINYAWNLGIRNAFIQEEGTVSESFIPEFDFKG
ncbi:MAG: 4Fe-4S cluster-binding domain-containing protein [Bacilli bacterium]|nr:4Fe-4S cluster-binding domain-containing protein [Bacilli bacterium]